MSDEDALVEVMAVILMAMAWCVDTRRAMGWVFFPVCERDDCVAAHACR